MSVAYGPSIVTNGLTMLVDAGNPRSYTGSGSTWYDLSNNNHAVSLVNSPTFNNAGAASYFNFNPSLSQTATTLANLTIPYTLNITYKLTTNTLAWIWSSAGTEYPYALAYSSTQIGFAPSNGTTLTAPAIGTAIVDYSWIYDGTNALIYQNGVLVASSAVSGTSSTSGLYFASLNGTAEYCPINIYRISIYKFALSPTQIAQNFNAIRGRYGL